MNGWPGFVEAKSSPRLTLSRTGRRSLNAAAATSESNSGHFPPKAPPSGVWMTRTRARRDPERLRDLVPGPEQRLGRGLDDEPAVLVRPGRADLRLEVALVDPAWSRTGPRGPPPLPRDSPRRRRRDSGVARRRSPTGARLSIDSSPPPPTPPWVWASIEPARSPSSPSSRRASGDAGSIAASGSRTTGRASSRTSTSSAASVAAASVSATTSATGSPANTTSPRASGRTSRSVPFARIGRSAAVRTATTPGVASAAVASMPRTLAWARCDRTRRA